MLRIFLLSTICENLGSVPKVYYKLHTFEQHIQQHTGARQRRHITHCNAVMTSLYATRLQEISFFQSIPLHTPHNADGDVSTFGTPVHTTLSRTGQRLQP